MKHGIKVLLLLEVTPGLKPLQDSSVTVMIKENPGNDR